MSWRFRAQQRRGRPTSSIVGPRTLGVLGKGAPSLVVTWGLGLVSDEGRSQGASRWSPTRADEPMRRSARGGG
eukprot:130726-Pyramimonas_sp.AAC.1